MSTIGTGVELESSIHEDDGEYRATYERETTPPSMAVLQAMVEADDADPVDLTPLYNVVDTDALDRMIGEESGPVRVSFVYEGRRVSVSNQGAIAIAPEDRDSGFPEPIRDGDDGAPE